MGSADTTPARQERLAIKLHNSLSAFGGRRRDELADVASTEAFLAALRPHLAPSGVPNGEWPTPAETTALRRAVRTALHAAVAGTEQDPSALELINAAAAQAPTSLRIDLHAGGETSVSVDHHGATRAQIVLGEIASDAIELIAGPDRDKVQACIAPGCDLYFFRDHPRRQWCSDACGNRARQARHYRRTRRRG
jgi:predicted RNA-binding Zn ribbon-like protein